jgi:acyl carrier protein|tara:strand:- start:422 stop:661 length:240 start_codon:yes stop_codon:yes gene_type:complete
MSKNDYNAVFYETLSIEKDKDITKLKYQDIEEWDSIGHMSLVSNLEDKFQISFETDDIVDFSSYSKGIEILKKYKVEIK